MDRIVAAFAHEEAQRRILRLLENGGYAVAGCFFSGADVIRAVHKLEGAAVVCGFRLRDMTAAELAEDLGPDTGILVIASAANLDLCQGENLYKLPVPASRADLYASVDMLLRFRREHAPPLPASAAGRGPEADPPGQGAADGCQPHERGGGPSLFAKAQHGHRTAAGSRPPGWSSRRYTY